jgi:hypothetical protein
VSPSVRVLIGGKARWSVLYREPFFEICQYFARHSRRLPVDTIACFNLLVAVI